MDATRAANVIKRAMRFHRDRVCTLMIRRPEEVSREIMIAAHCLYGYTDDTSGCWATMGNGFGILYLSPSKFVPAAKTSKGKMRRVYQTYNKEELHQSVLPQRYKPLESFLEHLKKRRAQRIKEELMIELYKPARILRWLKLGHALEDYLA